MHTKCVERSHGTGPEFQQGRGNSASVFPLTVIPEHSVTFPGTKLPEQNAFRLALPEQMAALL